MIKANELRIGNYIKRRSQEKTLTVDIGLLTKVQRQGFLFSPIPLTEETLLKVKGIHRAFYHVFENIELGLDGADFVEGYYSVKVGGVFITKIKYLHQLQNMHFELTKKELKL